MRKRRGQEKREAKKKVQGNEEMSEKRDESMRQTGKKEDKNEYMTRTKQNKT